MVVKRVDGYAHAGGGKYLTGFRIERCQERVFYFIGNGGDFFQAGGVFDQYRKFIATQSRNGVGGAQGGRQAFRHLLQQDIAGGVSARIVNLLKAVNVQNHHPEQRIVAFRALHGRIDAVEQQVAVGQPGEGVILRHEGQAFFRLAALGEIVQQAEYLPDFTGIVAYRHVGRRDRHLAATQR